MTRIVEYRRRLRGPQLIVPPAGIPVGQVENPEEPEKPDKVEETVEDEG
jgi:hypothetical protein